MAKNKSENKVEATADTSYKGTKEAPGMTITQVPITSIRVVPGFNVRKVTDRHPDGEGAREPFRQGSDKEPTVGTGSMGTSGDTLAAAIKKDGLLQPIILRPMGSGFDLVSGHRRFAAVKSLGWKSVASVVREMSDEEAYLINITENVQREDLSPGEVAERAIMLREKFPESFAPGTDGGSAALAKALNMSKNYMLNLIRLSEKLHPQIWEVVRSGRNPNAPPHHKLHKWVAMESHDEQWDAYCEWMGMKQDRDVEDGAPPATNADGTAATPETPKNLYKRPGAAALETMEQEILTRKRSKAINDNEAAVALAVLRYCIGRVGKDGNPPAPPYKAATSPVVEKN